MSSKRTLIGSSITPIRFVFFVWLVFVLEYSYNLPISRFGILPREPFGLIGIITAPLIHAGPSHLISNTVPLLFLGITLYFYYPAIANKVFYSCYFITNILVWLVARPSNHIGASGLIYGLAAFIIFFGLFRRDLKSLFLSAIVLVMYGYIFYGVLPSNPRVSWESHLMGAIVGLVMAWKYFDKRSVYK